MKLSRLVLVGWLGAFAFGISGTPAVRAAENAAEKAPLVRPLVRLEQSDPQLGKLERALADLVNAERAKLGLKALTYDVALSDVARAHSAEMRECKYFAHISPTPGLKTPFDRYQAALNTAAPVVAENLYGAWGGAPRQPGEADMANAHTALMKSPTHRANIVLRGLTHIGIGLTTNATGDVWITQMFIRAPEN